MPSTEENIEDVLNQLREALKSQPSSEKESDHLQPPSGNWAARIYENEYKPFPKWIKYLIRYGVVVIAFFDWIKSWFSPDTAVTVSVV